MEITSDGNGGVYYELYRNKAKKEYASVTNKEAYKEITKNMYFASIVFSGLIGLTIAEDILTSGAGVTNDAESLIAALDLVSRIFGK